MKCSGFVWGLLRVFFFEVIHWDKLLVCAVLLPPLALMLAVGLSQVPSVSGYVEQKRLEVDDFLQPSGREVDILAANLEWAERSDWPIYVIYLVESPKTKERRIFRVVVEKNIPVVGERWTAVAVAPVSNGARPTIK